MTDSFGARLRRERERRTIDIAQVAARTKIKASLFEALERDDVSQWPAGLFRRSFIRAYADAVGLDPQATLSEFMQHFPDPSEPLAGRPTERSSQVRPADTKRPEPRPVDPPVRTSAPPPTPPAPVAASPAVVFDEEEFEPHSEPLSLGTTELAAALRLTLAEADMPFQAGRILADSRARWTAAAWDLGVVFVVALVLFMIVGRFWIPLSISALSYYVVGIMLLGNSPGVFLMAPRDRATDTRPTEPARPPRPRHADPGRGRTPVVPREVFRAPRRARTTRT